MNGVKKDTYLRPSLRAAINAKCKSCIFDPLAMGTWRQQVTLCSVYSCPLWEIRPVSSSPIPESVLRYYQVNAGDPCLRRQSDARTTGIGEDGDVSSQGALKAPESDPEATPERDPGGGS